MLPTASAEYYTGQREVMISVLGAARRLWGTRPPRNFDDWFDRNIERLMAVLVAGQQSAVAGADEYVANVLDELGTPVGPEAKLVTDPLIGVASDGRGLDSLMYGPVITAKDGIASGWPVEVAWDAGMEALLVRAQTQIADASRAAVGLGIAARRDVGYVRMLNPPSCSRCALLAGKWYASNRGFARHPGCDCRHIPARENSAGDLRTDPMMYFDSLTAAQQDKLFTKAGAAAIRDGADITQVVNARRGMSTAQENIAGWIPKGRLSRTEVYGQQIATTTEGVTRRGVAYRAMSQAGYARRQTDVRNGRRYFQARAPRLMPEGIYEIAEDRDDALRLLRLYGYLSDGPTPRPRPSPGAMPRRAPQPGSGAPRTASGGGTPPGPPEPPTPTRSASDASDDDEFPTMTNGNPVPFRRSQVQRPDDDEIDMILEYNEDDGHGGHRHGQEIPNKTEFPSGWGRAEVREAIEAALSSNAVKIKPSERGVNLGIVHNEVAVIVAVNSMGGSPFVVTAYPYSGTGVIKNLEDGKRVVVPLDRNAFDEYLDT